MNTLLVFARVAENRSFTKASAALGMKKSTVSTKIAELESHLGTRLLNRNTRSVALTEAGEGYYRYCQRIIENAFEAEEFARTFSPEPQGTLRISAPVGIGRVLFRDLFKDFLGRYPRLHLDIHLESRAVDPIREGYDLSLVLGNFASRNANLHIRHIIDIEFGLFCSAVFAREHGRIETLEEFESLPYIHPFSNHETPAANQLVLHKDNSEYIPRTRERVVINNIEGCIAAVSHDLGIAVLPVNAVRDEIRCKTFVRVLNDYRIASIPLHVVYPNRSWDPSKQRVLLDFLDEWSSTVEAG